MVCDLAVQAGRGLDHVNSLQWAPRTPRDQIPALQHRARSLGLKDYQVFDVTPDFQRTALSDRPEYFPVLFDERPHGERRVLGLALGKYEGRRIPMERARDEGAPVATLPVRPVGRASGELVSDFDLFIGATALRHHLTLLTNNRRHFERIEGLRIISL